MLDAEAQEMPSSVPKVALSVLNLRYSPTSQHRKVQKFLVNAFHGDEAANLENVTFCANGGELMGVLAPDDAERRYVVILFFSMFCWVRCCDCWQNTDGINSKSSAVRRV